MTLSKQEKNMTKKRKLEEQMKCEGWYESIVGLLDFKKTKKRNAHSLEVSCEPSKLSKKDPPKSKSHYIRE